MSAVSSGSSAAAGSDPATSQANFGANEWLVEELYQRYLADPGSVDRAWWSFFADYTPALANGTGPQPVITAPAPPQPSQAPPPPPPQAAPARYAPGRRPPPPRRAPGRRPPQAAAAPSPRPHPRSWRARRSAGCAAAAARTVTNMTASLSVPTATSVRSVPAKLLADNRIVINNHLKRGRGGKVSFTHLIGYAVIQALKALPEMNDAYTEEGGKPAIARPGHVNLGLAIDVQAADGARQLLVPNIKAAEEMDFRLFWTSYEDIVRRARVGKLAVEDFQGTTATITNPGTIGTVHSVPRLMPGQGCIVGVGAMEYPAEYQGASEETLARLAISKSVTLTSTYDHRIIQGAQSGEFLKKIHGLLLGEDGFYDEIFAALRIPYEPVRWVRDFPYGHEDDVARSARVQELIHAYRVRGHLMADTNPLEVTQRKHPDLDINLHGLTLWDLEREFPTGGFGGKPRMKLRDILGVLRDSYCRTVGTEYMHIQDPEERRWLQARIEVPHPRAGHDEQMHILSRLNVAEAFEMFLQTKFVGQRRFSLEGAESLIPLIDAVLTEAADADLDEAVIGMAHRGRLNVLANIVGKSYGQIFKEFEGNLDPRSAQGSGDVKYHLGADGNLPGARGPVDQDLAGGQPEPPGGRRPGPGGRRAGQAGRDRQGRARLHRAARAHPRRRRVRRPGRGGRDPQPVAAARVPDRRHGPHHREQPGRFHHRAAVLAVQRVRHRRGPDDPGADLPRQRGRPRGRGAGRAARLRLPAGVQEGRGHRHDVLPQAGAQRDRQPVLHPAAHVRPGRGQAVHPEGVYRVADRPGRHHHGGGRGGAARLPAASRACLHRDQGRRAAPGRAGHGAQPEPEDRPVNHEAVPTAVSGETVKRIIDTQVNLPADFTPHPRLKPLLDRRAAMVEEDAIDWATGELLAFGSLVIDGRPVRLVGQDSRRGTFGQRHAVLVDRHTGREYTPLKQLDSGPAKFFVHDSLLSEYAAMGFEYGYSVARPEALVCWEAQFGDFVNGAQTITDEFISSGEQKWGQRSGVVLLLPHGYDGQGPDHSSARVERFLSLCAQDNMTVAMPTTPGNYFHLLRWQGLSGRHKPLIVFTPKSMLRLKAAASAVSEFTSGSFRPLIVGLQRRPGGCPAGPAVRREGVLRPRGPAAADRHDRGRDHPGRAAVPAAHLGAVRRAGPLPGRRVGHLGPGGAGQPGRLADHGAQAAPGAGP